MDYIHAEKLKYFFLLIRLIYYTDIVTVRDGGHFVDAPVINKLIMVEPAIGLVAMASCEQPLAITL